MKTQIQIERRIAKLQKNISELRKNITHYTNAGMQIADMQTQIDTLMWVLK